LVIRATTYPPIREPPAMEAVEILIVRTLSPLSSAQRPEDLSTTNDHRRVLAMLAYPPATGEDGPRA
jgi:hypothetical protein